MSANAVSVKRNDNRKKEPAQILVITKRHKENLKKKTQHLK